MGLSPVGRFEVVKMAWLVLLETAAVPRVWP